MKCLLKERYAALFSAFPVTAASTKKIAGLFAVILLFWLLAHLRHHLDNERKFAGRPFHAFVCSPVSAAVFTALLGDN